MTMPNDSRQADIQLSKSDAATNAALFVLRESGLLDYPVLANKVLVRRMFAAGERAARSEMVAD